MQLLNFACSGPGAGAAISSNEQIALWSAVGCGVLTGLIWWRSRSSQAWNSPATIAKGLMLLHPAWTISAISGDCGMLKRDASYVVAGVLVVLLAITFAQQRRARMDGEKALS